MGSHEPKTDVVVTITGVIPVAIGRAGEVVIEVPRPAVQLPNDLIGSVTASTPMRPE